jgi:hypothetical protein
MSDKKPDPIADIAASTVALVMSYDRAADPDGYPQFLFDAIVAAATLAADKVRDDCWLNKRFLAGPCNN